MKRDNLSRDKFNEYYDEAINDILILKDCNISIKTINEITSYQIDFIVFVLQMYQLNKTNNNEYTKSIKITSHNINDEIKKIGFSDSLIEEIINSKSGTEYYKIL